MLLLIFGGTFYFDRKRLKKALCRVRVGEGIEVLWFTYATKQYICGIIEKHTLCAFYWYIHIWYILIMYRTMAQLITSLDAKRTEIWSAHKKLWSSNSIIHSSIKLVYTHASIVTIFIGENFTCTYIALTIHYKFICSDICPCGAPQNGYSRGRWVQ